MVPLEQTSPSELVDLEPVCTRRFKIDQSLRGALKLVVPLASAPRRSWSIFVYGPVYERVVHGAPCTAVYGERSSVRLRSSRFSSSAAHPPCARVPDCAPCTTQARTSRSRSVCGWLPSYCAMHGAGAQAGHSGLRCAPPLHTRGGAGARWSPRRTTWCTRTVRTVHVCCTHRHRPTQTCASSARSTRPRVATYVCAQAGQAEA